MKGCRHYKFCHYRGDGCLSQEAATQNEQDVFCEEKNRRNKLANKPCPQMGDCDCPELRALLPADKSCCNGVCLPRMIFQDFWKRPITNPHDFANITRDEINKARSKFLACPQ